MIPVICLSQIFLMHLFVVECGVIVSLTRSHGLDFNDSWDRICMVQVPMSVSGTRSVTGKLDSPLGVWDDFSITASFQFLLSPDTDLVGSNLLWSIGFADCSQSKLLPPLIPIQIKKKKLVYGYFPH